MLKHINDFVAWADNNFRALLILCSIVLLVFVTLILLSWLAGYWLNGLLLYKFELASCWGGLGAVVTGLGSVATLAGINMTKHYINSKYNTPAGEYNNDKDAN